MYESCTYTSCEISPALSELQARRVAREAGHGHCFKTEVRDAADLDGWGAPDSEHCYILGMEVLDNCAHDKCGLFPLRGGCLRLDQFLTAGVRRVVKAADCSWRQEEVRILDDEPSLTTRPLSDPWIRHVLDAALQIHPKAPSLWRKALDALAGEGFLARASRESQVAPTKTIFLPTGVVLNRVCPLAQE